MWLKNKMIFSDYRSVIKARGLEQRSNVAGQTFAVFRVDATHHLLSFVTKVIKFHFQLLFLTITHQTK